MINNQANAYKETTIKTAGQGKLILMLYDGAIEQLKQAAELFPTGHQNYDKVNCAIVKAQDIITELTVSLNFEKGDEIAKSLFKLYMYFNDQLIQANMKKDEAALQTVLGMLIDLRTAWSQISSNQTNNNVKPTGLNLSY